MKHVLMIAFAAIAMSGIAAKTTAGAATPMPKTGICGHQGDMKQHPGNTVESLAAAIAGGAQMVEFDLQECKSGELVLMHDATINRLTTGKGKIAEWTLDELKKFEVKSRNKGHTYRIATFEEALAVIPTNGVWINVHCYGGRKRMAKIAGILKDGGRLHQAFICSSLSGVDAARAAVPEILACNIDRPGPRNRDWTDAENSKFIEDAKAHKCQFLQLCRPWPKEYSDAAHNAGVSVIYFYSDDPNVAKDLRRRGIDFIMTNNVRGMVGK